ncbi:superoxide dismutase [Nitrospira sp.]|nr:superoxide dismutase [Nitrospira sp.]
MLLQEPHRAQSFELHGLQGISDKTLEMHFKLYEGYVKATNKLRGQLYEIIRDQHIDQEEMPAYSELTRRLGFEYNGMVLHEYYFSNLIGPKREALKAHGAFSKVAEDSFGSFDLWKTDFTSVGNMRGVGWAICYLDPASGRVSNHWISLHEHGNIAGFVPLLVMDVWEHAYLLDYKPSERGEYIDAFFANVNWKLVEERLDLGVPALQRL